MRDKVAVITGASRGIGLSMAGALIAAGARVALFARNERELGAACETLGERSLACACDVSDPARVRLAFEQVVDRFGRIDCLVNNAAICEPHRVEESTDLEIDTEIGVNLAGAVYCVRAAIPHLRKTRGQIINVSSESVRFPFPYLAVYAATKAGLEAFSSALRAEVKADGIRVTVLRLGNVRDTGITHRWSEPVSRRYFDHVAESGHLALCGGAAKPASVAQALLRVLGMPEDLNLEIVEVKPA
jgi:NAD(P)-dependent dehydrogenase (short-subunit alcohol dehydrogenase family)